MNIPVNPLQNPVFAAVLAVELIAAIWCLVLLRKKPKPRAVAATVLGLAVALTMTYGIIQRNHWRDDTVKTLNRDYGIVIKPEATSDLLVRKQTVKAQNAKGENITVKLRGDYQNDGKLVTGGKVLPKLK